MIGRRRSRERRRAASDPRGIEAYAGRCVLSGNGAEEALDFRTAFHGRLLDLLGSGKDGLS